ncbi:MAG: YtxH domain-containing protein, partial [Desulfuromonadales bacterium]|nr:YtxH domain-containing protein [Desulfuromonadales bacterium]
TLALLYAPQSGEKTRRQLNRTARKVRNEAEEIIRDAAESITEVVEDLSDKTTELTGRGEEVAEDWRNYLFAAIDRGQKELEKQRKKLDQWWR